MKGKLLKGFLSLMLITSITPVGNVFAAETAVSTTSLQDKTITGYYPQSIVIDTYPNKVNYKVGESIDITGLKVNAIIRETYTYIEEGETKSGSQYETLYNVPVRVIYPYKYATIGSSSYTIAYDYNQNNTSSTLTNTIRINVSHADNEVTSDSLTSLKIGSMPSKTTYNVGENFDAKGLSITGTYTKTYYNSPATTYDVANMNYTLSSNTSLKAGQTSVTATVRSNSGTQTIAIPITVNPYVTNYELSEIYFAKHPNKVVYKAGELITTDGMVINAVFKETYSDGTVQFVTKENVPVRVSYPFTMAQVGSNTITFVYYYSEKGASGRATIDQQIDVTKNTTSTSTLTNVEKQVVPSKVKITSVKAGKKKITVKWKKAKHAVKYKVYYRLKVKNKKKQKKIKWKSKTVKLRKCTIKKLQSKKTYQVRVRAYNGKVHGAYSATKKVKVK